MKFWMIILIMMVLVPLSAQSTDTTQNGTQTVQNNTITSSIDSGSVSETDDFSPLLFIMVLFAVGVVLLGIGAGIALTVMVLVFMFFLISSGLLSASILIGLYHKSFIKGFKVFIISAAVACGLFLGVVGFWLLNMLVHWRTIKTAILLGAGCGLAAGLGFGFLAFFVFQRLTKYFLVKLKINL